MWVCKTDFHVSVMENLGIYFLCCPKLISFPFILMQRFELIIAETRLQLVTPCIEKFHIFIPFRTYKIKLITLDVSFQRHFHWYIIGFISVN